MIKKEKGNLQRGQNEATYKIKFLEKSVVVSHMRIQNMLFIFFQGLLFSCSFIPHLFFKTFFSSEYFQVHSKTERKLQRFPIQLLPPHNHSLLHSQHPPPQWYIITTDGSGLTHHNHLKSIVSMRAHPWCYTYCFGQVNIDLYLP